jgi:DNA-binding transcriptional MocR family regulator
MDSGDLPPGTALPSTRALASALGLSRNTVVTAYEELAADGRIAGREGSATRVVGNSRAPRMPQWGTVLRLSQYPLGAVRFRDPDSNALYFHR